MQFFLMDGGAQTILNRYDENIEFEQILLDNVFIRKGKGIEG